MITGEFKLTRILLERKMKNKSKSKSKPKIKIHCHKCKTQADCCNHGAWADIEEAKVIASLGLKGEFFQLEKDREFPSGYKIGTSYEDERCTFLDPDGLCSIHKINYDLKPNVCKEFPYENGSLAPLVESLCTLFKSQIKKKAKK